jgi:hypothetical protein
MDTYKYIRKMSLDDTLKRKVTSNLEAMTPVL